MIQVNHSMIQSNKFKMRPGFKFWKESIYEDECNKC